MTWIEKRVADLKNLEERRASIREHATTVYESLWSELLKHVDDANQHGLDVTTNGSARRKIIKLKKQNLSGMWWELEFKLSDAKDRITVRGDRCGDVQFLFDLRPDNVVCLKVNGKEISIEEAAIAILDPFLFPQLQ